MRIAVLVLAIRCCDRFGSSGLRGQLPDHEQLGAAGQPLHRQDRHGQVRVHPPMVCDELAAVQHWIALTRHSGPRATLA